MPKPVPLPPTGFDDLSVDEKIDYLQSLWDRIAATPETIPVPDWHHEMIDERLKDLEAPVVTLIALLRVRVASRSGWAHHQRQCRRSKHQQERGYLRMD